MCVETLIMAALSAGLSAVGGQMARSEQQKNTARQVRARNEELRAERERQHQYLEENARYNQQAQAKFQEKSQEKRQAENADARVAENVSAVPQVSAQDVPLAGSTPEIVKGELAKRMLEAHQASTDRAKALGQLKSYDDTWMQNGFDVNQASRKVDTVNNFSRGSAALLPYSQDFAQYAATKPSSGMGELLQGLGGFVGSAAGSGKLKIPTGLFGG